MTKKLQWFAVVMATVLFLVGCQTNQDTKDNTGTDNGVENTKYSEGDTARKSRRDANDRNRDITQNVKDGDRANDNRNRADDDNFRSNHRSSNNTQNEYDVSTEAADQIVDKVDEIDQAYVLTTKNNAYVAAKLDNDDTPNDPIAKNDRDNNSTGTDVRHSNDRNAKERTVNEGDSNRRGPDNHTANRRDTEEEAVTDEVKNEIAEIVQDVDGDIDNVYVSTSPDFLDLVGNYSDDMDNGKPVRGFFDQIGNTIERIFPQSKR